MSKDRTTKRTKATAAPRRRNGTIVAAIRQLAASQATVSTLEVRARFGWAAQSSLSWLHSIGELERVSGGVPGDPSVYRLKATPEAARLARLGRRGNYGVGGVPRAMVDEMWADFQRLGTLAAVGRRHGRSARGVAFLLAKHGLRAMGPATRRVVREKDGLNRFLPYADPTDAEILAKVATLRRVMIPPGLQAYWRRWPEAKRRWLVAAMHARVDALRPADAPPAGPPSANVEPFDYFSPRARAIAAAENGDRPSRHTRAKLKLAARGLIWQGRLFYWVRCTGYMTGAVPRESLHHAVWESVHGPLPASRVIYFRDGNPNNHDPANLGVKTRNELARENQAAALLRRSRLKTAALLTRFERNNQPGGTPHEHHELDGQIRAAGR